MTVPTSNAFFMASRLPDNTWEPLAVNEVEYNIGPCGNGILLPAGQTYTFDTGTFTDSLGIPVISGVLPTAALLVFSDDAFISLSGVL